MSRKIIFKNGPIIPTLFALALAFVMNGSASANDAGCGLGSLVMQKNTKVSQTLAVTTNGTFMSQLFGITSGTSNCSASGLVKNEDKEATMYAETNFQSLRVEMARGQGENLAAFAQLFGCQDGAIARFGQMTHDKFEAIYPASGATPVEMVQSVRTQMQQDAELSKSCRPVS